MKNTTQLIVIQIPKPEGSNNLKAFTQRLKSLLPKVKNAAQKQDEILADINAKKIELDALRASKPSVKKLLNLPSLEKELAAFIEMAEITANELQTQRASFVAALGEANEEYHRLACLPAREIFYSITEGVLLPLCGKLRRDEFLDFAGKTPAFHALESNFQRLEGYSSISLAEYYLPFAEGLIPKIDQLASGNLRFELMLPGLEN